MKKELFSGAAKKCVPAASVAAKKYGPAALTLAVGLLSCELAMAANSATEFDTTSTKFTNWVTGTYGKAAASMALMTGIGVAAFTKDFMMTLKGAGVALVVPIVMGIINGAFTAVI